jgi:hypothetical protein
VTHRKLTILFTGMIAADPAQGGATWAVLQYVLGLRRLGHDVYFVEPVPDRSLRPAGASLAESDNASYFAAVRTAYLKEKAALVRAGSSDTDGMSYDELRAVARRADVLINVSGMLQDEALISRIPVRVYLDLDPAFVQLWHATQGIDMRFDAHNRFVTVGLQIGRPGCDVPTCGRDWVHTLQPVVLDAWPASGGIVLDGLTTVANWRGYGSIEHNGVHYGQKAHSLRKLIDLPARTPEKFMLVLNIDPGETADLAALKRYGWDLLRPARTGTPWDYKNFIHSSKAEFGLAKSGYVASRCGWFSDRSACYLASGRPVIAQETGWQEFLPAGEGLFSFDSADDVLAAIDSLNANYSKHRRAARSIAETYFDSDLVLSRLLEAVGAA